MFRYKSALLNRIEEKLSLDRMKPYLTPKSIASRKEDTEIMEEIMEELEDHLVVTEKSAGTWQLVSEDLQDYVDAFEKIESRDPASKVAQELS